MRIRWHRWWLVALAGTACSLNPQPELPGDRSNGNGSNAGTSGVTVPGNNGSGATGVAAGGSVSATAPDASTGEAGSPDMGTGGAPDAAGAPGEPPLVGQAGAR